jgi:hypothetical protein
MAKAYLVVEHIITHAEKFEERAGPANLNGAISGVSA